MANPNIEVKDGLVYRDNKLIGFVQDATKEQKDAYRRAAKWTATVEHFVPNPQADKHPDGRVFTGRRVGDLGPNKQGKIQMRAPSGEMQEIDLSGFHVDDKVRITWHTENTPL